MKDHLRLLSRFGLVGFLVLGLVGTCAAQELPPATRVWSVGPLANLVRTTGNISFGPGGGKVSGLHEVVDSQTSLPFEATRSVVFAGDRIVLATMTGRRTSSGAQGAEQVYEVLSLDARTGEIKSRREFLAPPAGWLMLFATNDAHVIISGAGVWRVTPDLADDGSFDYHANGHERGSVESVSPDGSTLGNSLSPGFELIDARTLKPTSEFPAAWANGASLNDSGFVTNLRSKEYWKYHGAITYIDAAGTHLLYYGKCGEFPKFLRNDLILEPGCENPLIFDMHGNLVRTLPVKGEFAYAGVSQNGKRFALQIAKFSNEHSLLKEERFVIYSVDSGEPVAEVTPDARADQQSWTAFSPNGSMFVVGSPLKLTLYRLP